MMSLSLHAPPARAVGLQESRVAASAAYPLRRLHVNLFGSLVWDFFLENIEEARAGLAFDPLACDSCHDGWH